MKHTFIQVRAMVPMLVWATLGGLACREKVQTKESLCREDSDCQAGYICENFQCIPAESKSCEVVIDGNPILQSTPHRVAFGELDTLEKTQRLSFNNIGNCTLTIFEVLLASKGTQGFSCPTCESTKFPIEIFPNREKPLEIKFTATQPGKYTDELVILSDDRQFPEMRIPLSVNFLGITDLRVTPFPLDFGYLPQGRMQPKLVQLTNQGTGTAFVEIQSVSLAPSDTVDFELPSASALQSAQKLYPIESETGLTYSFEVQYHPRSIGKHAAELVVRTSKGEVRVPVSGNSETPPKINVLTDAIDLGQVPLGQSQFRALTLSNEGGSPLTVDYSWGGVSLSTDLFGVPALLAPIAPAGYVELQVAVTATKLGPIQGILLLKTNDPSRPQVSIPVSAEGVQGPGPEVVKLELTYENGSDGLFDKDFRNVDLTLEHPFGYPCNKQAPNPTNWGTGGTPTWIGFGPKEEPERIILVNATQDGKYRVMLQYMQDCSSLPSELLAGILGVATDVAQLAAAGTVVVPGKDVSKAIEKVCLNHDPTTASVRVYVNGDLIKEVSAPLQKTGDVVFPIELVRDNGKFTAQ